MDVKKNRLPNTFSFYGYEFQIKLLSQIISDERFANYIIDNIDANYFDNNYLRFIMQLVKEYYNEYGKAPDFSSLRISIREQRTGTELETFLDTVTEIEQTKLSDGDFIQNKARLFCTRQNLKNALDKSRKILDSGDFEKLDQVPTLISDATDINNEEYKSEDVFEEMDEVLSENYRNPIPTHINGIDKYTKGGLSSGEVGLIIAPLGVGKTTILTKIANSAYNAGYNVLQVVFEDKPKEIKRKHYACWSQVALDKLDERKTDVKERVKEFQNKRGNKLFIHKFNSYGTNLNKIKNLIKRKRADGYKIDLLVVDYLECISRDNKYDSEWAGEGSLLRQIEGIADYYDLTVWSATQGNRSSLNADVVTTEQIGGEIKKAQVGHFIMSVAKTMEQKEQKRATMAILKSRFGDDGKIFRNAIFDNSRLIIDTQDDEVNIMDFEQEKHNLEAQNEKEMLEDAYRASQRA